MVKKKKVKKPSQGIAIAALILNIIVLPGVGSLVGGRTREGVWQLVLFCLGAFLSVLSLFGALLFAILIGIPLFIASWIWGLVTGIQLIKDSQK